MIKKIIPVIFVVIPILFQQALCGQVPGNMEDFLRNKFSDYTTSVPREEIYVHTDRANYISGEELWFNIYLIDRKSLKVSSVSKIAYFELLNSENRPIVQKKIWLEGGSGPGQVVLPDTLSTGIYTIRAYTSWMKNFLPVNCFRKDLHVFNAFSSRALKEKINTRTILPAELSPENYPSTANTGLKLRVDNLKPDILEINVETDEKYRVDNNNRFYLFIQTRGNINHISAETATYENTKIIIPKKQLSDGINQITIFNSRGKPVCERFIYTPEDEVTAVKIHSADSTGVRNKVSIDFEFGRGLNTTVNSSCISISVSPVTNEHSVTDINDYMVFGTEFMSLQGSPLKDISVRKLPAEIIDSLLQNVKSNWIDWNVVLSDGLPDFKYQMEKNDHYITGKLLTSEKKEANAGKFVLLSSPGKIAAFQYARTDKEGNFSFRIPFSEKINELILQPDITYKNQSLNIESPFSDRYLNSGVSHDSAGTIIPDYISVWSVNHQVRKIYGISSVGAPLHPSISTPRIKRFYGKPDQELIMKDYILLPVMQEVFFELIVGAFLKNKKGGYEITIADPETNKPYETLPGLFIDGVKIKDPGIIAGLDPEVVEKIDVERNRYFVGDYLFYGIVNIITKAGDFSNATLPDDAIRLPYRVIDPVSSFVSPDYSSAAMKKSRIPDFRNTLYWNPTVRPDAEGNAKIEFWTSDFVSDYEVNIQGITPGGKIFSLKKIIRISK